MVGPATFPFLELWESLTQAVEMPKQKPVQDFTCTFNHLNTSMLIIPSRY